MIALAPDQFSTLLPFVPDQPQATLPVLCLRTGRGEAFVDDAVKPRNIAVVLRTTDRGGVDRLFLYGNPGSDDIARLLRGLRSPTEVFCDEPLAELVCSIHQDATARCNLVYTFDRLSEGLESDFDPDLRRLRTSHATELAQLVPAWAWSAFDGPKEMLMAGAVYGYFQGEELASAAFLSDSSVKYETLSAVTRDVHRGRGFALACCRRLMKYSMDRGYLPRGMVSTRNAPGIGLAERLQFPVKVEVRSWLLDPF